MLPKNVIPYVLHTELPDEQALLEAMEPHRTTAPLSANAARSIGWQNAFENELIVKLVLDNKAYFMVALLRRERLLPPAVVEDEVEEKVAEIEAREERFVTRKEKSVIREQVTDALLPRAFIRTKSVFAWIDTDASRILVDSASRARAEELLDLLRTSLGSLKVTPLSTAILPVRAMTNWATGEELPPSLTLGDTISLQSKGDDGTITARKVDISGDDIQAALESGRMAERLGISVTGELTAVLTSDLTLKGIKIADARIEASGYEMAEDARQAFMADFIISVTGIGQSLDFIISALGGQTTAIPLDGECSLASVDAPADDHLYDDAVSHVRETQKASISALQRRFKIAYTRASELMLQMERNGVVSPLDSQAQRHILKPAA